MSDVTREKTSLIKALMSRILLSAMILIVASCGDSSGLGGGTSVSNPPTVPVSSFSPDFEALVAETALGDTGDVESLALDFSPQFAVSSGPASFWDDVVLAGPVAQARFWRGTVQDWLTSLAERVNDDDDFDLSDSPTYALENLKLVDQQRDWIATVRQRGEFLEVTARRVGDGDIAAQALLQTDDDGGVVRGQFAFIGPETLRVGAAGGVRFFAIAFDFTDAADARLTTTFDAYEADLGYFVVTHLSYECDATDGGCALEVLRQDGRSPRRDFGERSIRVDWREDTAAICAASVAYGDDGAELGETQAFLGGANAPAADDVTEGGCVLREPYWSAHVKNPTKLPARFDDDDLGGYASSLYGSGTSLIPWQRTLSDSAIDDWLFGEFE